MRKISQSLARGSSTTTTAMGTEGRRRRGGPTACCSKVGMKKGPWTPEEDEMLASFVRREGEGRWRTLPKRAGLRRCGKSCRLRWMNYLRPSIKRGPIAPDEEDIILRLHRLLGNRWSLIAGRIPGRTDNEIKNYWNTHLSKKLIGQGIDPRTHKPLPAASSAPAGIQQPSPPVLPCPNPNPNPSCNSRPMGIAVEGLHNHDEDWKNSGCDSIDATAGNQEDGELGIDCYADDIFSFLDSLINEDAFRQEQEQDISNNDIENHQNNCDTNDGFTDHDREMKAAADASVTPSADPMLGGLTGTGWESDLGHSVDLKEHADHEFPSDHNASK